MDAPSLSPLYNDFPVLFDDFQLSNADPHLVQYHYQPSIQIEATFFPEGTNLNSLETNSFDGVMQDRFFDVFPLPMSNEVSYEVNELRNIAKKDLPFQQSGQREKLDQDSSTYRRNTTTEVSTLLYVSPTEVFPKPKLVCGAAATTVIDNEASIITTLRPFNSTPPSQPEQAIARHRKRVNIKNPKGNNSYGRHGTLRCIPCRKHRQKCVRNGEAACTRCKERKISSECKLTFGPKAESKLIQRRVGLDSSGVDTLMDDSISDSKYIRIRPSPHWDYGRTPATVADLRW